jgi:hypothetical protein
MVSLAVAVRRERRVASVVASAWAALAVAIARRRAARLVAAASVPAV